MPTGPLYYQPLVRAEILATPVGPPDPRTGKPLDLHSVLSERVLQFNFVDTGTGEHQIQPRTKLSEQFLASEFAQPFAEMMTGVENLQKRMPGADPLSGMKLSFTKEEWIANGIETAIETNPGMLDTTSPEDAAKIGAQMVQQAEQSYEASDARGMRVNNGILEVTPKASLLVEKRWMGEPAFTEPEAAWFSTALDRELHRQVTPAPAGVGQTPVGWLEDSSLELLGLWPGRAGMVASELGFGLDPAKVDEVAMGFRKEAITDGALGPGMRSVATLLDLAGIDAERPEAWADAYGLLAQRPLPQVPGGIAQAIVGSMGIDETRTGWVANRILETGGQPGNVDGLAAQLRELAPPKDQPPAGDPPPGDPPPGDPPPADPPPADPPPAQDPPPDDPPPAGPPQDPAPPGADAPPATPPTRA